jgi:hypothetical protein
MVQIIGGTLCFLDNHNFTTLAQLKSFPESHVGSSDTSPAPPECNPSDSDLIRLTRHVGFLMVCNFAQFFSVDSYTILIQSIDIGRIGA